MKRSLNLNNGKRAQLWLDEAPHADFLASTVVKRLVMPTRVVSASRRIAAVEFVIPLGGMIAYGLLGGELVHSDVDGLEVVVSVNPEGAPFRSSLMTRGEEMSVGLIGEYAEGVVKGVERANDICGLPSGGILRFRWAAHGIYGSSRLIFESLGGLIVRLLTLKKDATEEDTKDILDSAWRF
jgi:hypothetical protein